MILSRLRSRFLPRRASPRPVRGTVSSVIVVREPAPCFREALFVLRDEYLAGGACGARGGGAGRLVFSSLLTARRPREGMQSPPAFAVCAPSCG